MPLSCGFAMYFSEIGPSLGNFLAPRLASHVYGRDGCKKCVFNLVGGGGWCSRGHRREDLRCTKWSVCHYELRRAEGTEFISEAPRVSKNILGGGGVKSGRKNHLEEGY